MKENLLKAIEELKQIPKINIKGKEYATVASRVEIFRRYFPAYSIVSEIIVDDEQRVVIKAKILNENQIIVADGYAEEIRGEGLINKTSALENAQTSAIGRALAAFGLIGGEYASSFEVEKAINQQSTQIKQSYDLKEIILNENEKLKDTGLSVYHQDGMLIVQGKSFGKQDLLKKLGFKWNPAKKIWLKNIENNARKAS